MDEGNREKQKQRGNQGTVWLQSLAIACSMYSRIPVPMVEWTEQGMKYALCFFPFVGAVIGAVMTVYAAAARRLGLGGAACACLGSVIPILISGGIHMDGFLDTVDARSSCQTRERKLEILKDSHTGAFAIIGCCVYLLVYVAVFSELGEHAFPAAAAVYVMTRSLSGWAVVSFPKAKKDGLVSTFAAGAEDRAVQLCMVIWGTASAVYLVLYGGLAAGLCTSFAALAVLAWYYRMTKREFGGITGDLAGYFLQICELAMLAVLAVFH